MDDPSSIDAARAQWHALHFNRLIDACGGYGRVLELKATRIRKPSALYDYGNPNVACTAPADVVADLERLCGKPIYSAAIADSLPASAAAHDVFQEACQATAELGELMRVLLEAKASRGKLTRRATDVIVGAVRLAITELRDVEATVLERGTVEPVAPPAEAPQDPAGEVVDALERFGRHHVLRRAS